MKTRIIVGFSLGVLLLATLYFGGIFYIAAVSLVSLCATYEVAHVITRRGLRPLVFPAYICAAAFPFVYHFFGLDAMFILFIGCIVLSVCVIVLCGLSDAFRSAGTLLLYIYPLSMQICALLCYASFPRPVGLTAACLAYAAPSCADMFAYFGGTWFGKHKLCEQISPKKTIEGSIAAFIGGLFFGAQVIWLQKLWDGTVPWWAILVIGFLCGGFSQIGDLFASIIKRWADVKDFSSVFPGHGGVMDRLDSILICSCVVFCGFLLLKYFSLV